MPQQATRQQETAHALLIELLANQFANPVSWIETQDTILSEAKGAQRLIEIGPASILSGMANRTIQTKYVASDAARSIQREILSFAQHEDKIRYEAKEQPSNEDPGPPSKSIANNARNRAQETPKARTKTRQTLPPSPISIAIAAVSEAVPEAPIPAEDIIRTLIAQKLKRDFEEISLNSSIKSLSGGKSTLQNEILGDLAVEFTSMPEFAEELALGDIAKTVASDGKPGPQSSKLISRLMSAKMPAGFSYTSAKKYLESRWSFGPLRQQAVFLEILLHEPQSRLPTTDDAKVYIDTLVVKYAARKNLQLISATGTVVAESATVVDSASVELLRVEQNNYIQQQLHLHSKLLNDGRDDAIAFPHRIALERDELQRQLDRWNAEHGEAYKNGILPNFDVHKVRVYDSWWNWARVEASELLLKASTGDRDDSETSLLARCTRIANRSDDKLLSFIQAWFMEDRVHHHDADTGDCLKLLQARLTTACGKSKCTGPVIISAHTHTRPKTTIDSRGNIEFTEILVGDDDESEVPTCSTFSGSESSLMDYAFKSIMTPSHSDTDSSSTPNESFSTLSSFSKGVHLKSKTSHGWQYNSQMTKIFMGGLQDLRKLNMSLSGRYALVTGAGPRSIGSDVVKCLLEGGAKVLVTTSRFSSTIDYFNALYKTHGARGSELRVAPFNQGSHKDVEALLDYVHKPQSENGLAWDFDYIIPFAAIPETGRDISQIDSTSELAHRIMLTNTIRLLGGIMEHKRQLRYTSQPSQVILPLSPNNGQFGGDGLYSESKMSLEALFEKGRAENWDQYLSICGANIGWTRGTGLMDTNDIVCESLEHTEGVKTFSRSEMAFYIVGLLHPAVGRLCEDEPIMADLTGGITSVSNLKDKLAQIRQSLKDESLLRKTVYNESLAEQAVIYGHQETKPLEIELETTFNIDFPPLPDFTEDIQALSKTLGGMMDLDKVVVITGFSELGPWGSARTRWQMEVQNSLNDAACLELAWIMGMIGYHDGPLGKEHYSGWIDRKTHAPVLTADLSSYEQRIMQYVGIRKIEPEIVDGYDPENKTIVQEVVIEEDLDFFEASKEVAESFKKKHGDSVDIVEEDGQHRVRMKRGATLLVPRSVTTDRLVAGLLPTGYDPSTYGIPQDIIDRVDPVTLYALICVSEALLSSGITDPYEIYQHIHLSEVANCIGSSSGGLKALRAIYRDRFTDTATQKDILQETFINSTSAWVNMLLMSATGPIRTPVGACTTSIESLDLGYEAIVSGKARFCLVGGTDDFQEENSTEFGSMNATNNTIKDFAQGRTAREASRPCTSTRAGFVEAQGAGVQVLMSASLALEIGAPIRAIVGTVVTAADKISRSVPAPGQGILSAARENASETPSRLLDIAYRKERLMEALQLIQQQEQHDMESTVDTTTASNLANTDVDRAALVRVRSDANRRRKETLRYWGTEFWKHDTTISPIRGSLATWGLTIDDLTFQSFHGTSTVANDSNESEVTCKQLRHLGRKKGHPVLGVWQKSITGHGKAAAGAWQLNGCLQMFSTGIVPGNHNADNIDAAFQNQDDILYLDRKLDLGCQNMKAFSLTSFGFGQKGAQAIGVHSRYLFATLSRTNFDEYKLKCRRRQQRAEQIFQERIITNKIFIAKQKAPYEKEHESVVLLDPSMRATLDPATESYAFDRELGMEHVKQGGVSPEYFPEVPSPGAGMNLEQTIEEQLKCVSRSTTNEKAPDVFGVGVDAQDLASASFLNENFILRNFTDLEQNHAQGSARGPSNSYAGTWAAKEAVFKSLGIPGKGSAAGMACIEILRDGQAKPQVELHADVKTAALEAGIVSIEVSITYGETQAIAVAMCRARHV